jgi:hypothetical protein
MLKNAVTFTANVTSTAGTPTGSVTFLDGAADHFVSDSRLPSDYRFVWRGYEFSLHCQQRDHGKRGGFHHQREEQRRYSGSGQDSPVHLCG